MSERKVAPYGAWPSPITAEVAVGDSVRLGQIAVDGEDVYWTEGRPQEGGRNAIVRRRPDGQILDVTPAAFNARTRAHEYGGGDFAVADGMVYFSNFEDQRIYRQASGSSPQPVTSGSEMRYADGIIDRFRDRMICVREDHTAPGEAVNTLVSLDFLGGDGQVLVSGNDFYSSPRLSPDGRHLAWLTWRHPNMPWDGTELWVGDVRDDGTLGNAGRVAGAAEESIFQPEWSPGGELYFVSDRTGWWNLYRWRDGYAEPMWTAAAEFGLPQWGFGMSTYAFASARQMVCAYNERGVWRLACLDIETKAHEAIEIPYTDVRGIRAAPDFAVFLAGSATQPASVVRLDLHTRKVAALRRAQKMTVDAGYLSSPRAIEFPTTHGLTAHAFFYPPNNRDFCGPADERPPLLVMSHGGPTSSTSTTLQPGVQYWTSRGIAVLDVNYGGSAGYGRAYRQRLNGKWGIVDVDDCVNGARHLVERGEADGARLAITGGSAGGYTTLCALTFRDTFRAGASYYGVSDLEALAKETHKFESRYLDSLIGPYPERADLYRARSPIHAVRRLACPVILFQGLEDRVVPPNQAETMLAAVRAKGLPVAYVPFEGEQHGFRRAENKVRALEAELYFYARVFGFELADPVAPVRIENL